jgi:hypothetical protein
MTAKRRQIVHLEDLVGRRVRAGSGQVVGRIEEIRAQRRSNGDHDVTEYHLGTGALFERLAIVGRLVGNKPRIIVRWDQLDIRRPTEPTLTCPVEELRYEER